MAEIKPEQVPKEAVTALATRLRDFSHGYSDTALMLMAADFAAVAINAWPGKEWRESGYYPNGVGGPGATVTERLVLPFRRAATQWRPIETVWLVERQDGACFTGYIPTLIAGWSQDYADGIRFSRRVDAQKMAARLSEQWPCRATEHRWVDSPLPHRDALEDQP